VGRGSQPSREAPVIHKLESSLRDERHRVIPTGGISDRTDPKYPWKFKELVIIAHPDAPPPTPKGGPPTGARKFPVASGARSGG
jgi:hypothetical protein